MTSFVVCIHDSVVDIRCYELSFLLFHINFHSKVSYVLYLFYKSLSSIANSHYHSCFNL